MEMLEEFGKSKHGKKKKEKRGSRTGCGSSRDAAAQRLTPDHTAAGRRCLAKKLIRTV